MLRSLIIRFTLALALVVPGSMFGQDTLLVTWTGTPGNIENTIMSDTTAEGVQAHAVYKLEANKVYLQLSEINLYSSCAIVGADPGEGAGVPSICLSGEEPKEGGAAAVPLQLIFLLTILSLAPSILIMMTSFTRIVVVLSFLRTAIGTNGQMPPNQLIIGLALFLTFFIRPQRFMFFKI